MFDGAEEDIIGWFDGAAESAGADAAPHTGAELRCGVSEEMAGGIVNIQDVPDSELEALYTRLVPLATYADFELFIQRIIDGDTTPLLTQQPITSLSQTLGQHLLLSFCNFVRTILSELSRAVIHGFMKRRWRRTTTI